MKIKYPRKADFVPILAPTKQFRTLGEIWKYFSHLKWDGWSELLNRFLKLRILWSENSTFFVFSFLPFFLFPFLKHRNCLPRIFYSAHLDPNYFGIDQTLVKWLPSLYRIETSVRFSVKRFKRFQAIRVAVFPKREKQSRTVWYDQPQSDVAHLDSHTIREPLKHQRHPYETQLSEMGCLSCVRKDFSGWR